MFNVKVGELDKERIIIKDFFSALKMELKNISLYKFREEIIRYNFYKTLLKNNFECENIIYESNFENGKNNKVDLKFENNYVEFKFDTLNLKNSKEKKEKANRPKTMRLAKSILDLFKLKYGKSLSKNQCNSFYFIYCCDNGFKKYIKTLNELDFFANKKIEYSLYFKKFSNYIKNNNPEYKNEGIVSFKILEKCIIKDKLDKELNIIIFKITN